MLENLIFNTLEFKPLLLTPAEVATTLLTMVVRPSERSALQNFNQVICSAIEATNKCFQGK